MPLSKFREVHAADIDAAMLADIDRRIAGGGSRKRSAEGMADGGEERGVKVPFTPAATKGASKAEALSRMPRQVRRLRGRGRARGRLLRVGGKRRATHRRGLEDGLVSCDVAPGGPAITGTSR